MKFSHTFVAASLLLALPISVQASSIPLPDDINFYGKAEVLLNFTDKGQTDTQDGLRYVDQGTQIDTPTNLIGLKGFHKFSNSLTAVFKYEYQVEGFDSDADTFKARNNYVGVKGGFGELIFGRNDTRFKVAEGKVDLFNQTTADIAQTMAGQDRLGDTATYISPAFRRVKFAFTAVPKDDSGADENGYAWSVTTGDKSMRKLAYYAAYAGTQDLNGLDMHRFLVNCRIKAVTLGALFQSSEKADGSKEGNGYMFNASYRVKNIVAKIQYAFDDSEIRHNEESDQITVGADYIFDKQTKVYALYTQLNLETNEDDNVGVGLQYKF